MGVVALERRGQVALRDAQSLRHLGHRLPAVDELDQRHLRHLHVCLVDDQIRGLVGLLEDERRGARVVGILGDEPIAFGVDDDAGQQDLGRIGGRGDEQLVHVRRHAPRRDAQFDAQPVVVRVAQNVGRDHAVVFGLAFLAQRGRVLGDHVRVHREAARGDHHGIGLDVTAFVEALPAHAHDGAVAVDDECGGAGLVTHRDTERLGALQQQVDDHGGAAEFPRHRNRMPAGSGLGLLAERPHLLVSGVGQPLGAGRDDDLARVVAAFELEPEILEPVEVFDAAVAVRADLVVLGFPGLCDQVLVHLVGRVVVARGALHGGAAAEIEVAAGHRRGAAGVGALLQDQNLRACCGGADGRAAAGDAETEHDDVGLVGPVVDVGDGDRLGDLLHAHLFSWLTWSFT